MTVLKTRRARLLAAACTALLGVACSGGDEPELSIVPQGGARAVSDAEVPGPAPEILSLHLDPATPVPGERIRAQARATNADGTRPSLSYEWTLRGRVLGQDKPSIMLPAMRKGERVEVKVVARNGDHESAPAYAVGAVPNRPPRIRDLRLRSRSVGDEGEEWIAELLADDPDGDTVELEYTWLLNDEPHEVHDAVFPTDVLKRGDRLVLRVIASDGEDESPPAKSGVVTVANASPDILSEPPSLDGSDLYSYQLKASDPDGDRVLRWQLVEGPRGMKLDTQSGLITWRPTASQDGTHRIEVAVEDGQGGHATQIFDIAIVVEYGVGPAAMR
jgi:hypothetical protein